MEVLLHPAEFVSSRMARDESMVRPGKHTLIDEPLLLTSCLPGLAIMRVTGRPQSDPLSHTTKEDGEERITVSTSLSYVVGTEIA